MGRFHNRHFCSGSGDRSLCAATSPKELEIQSKIACFSPMCKTFDSKVLKLWSLKLRFVPTVQAFLCETRNMQRHLV